MRGTGFVKRVDYLGRFIIPKNLRKRNEFNTNCLIEFFTDNEGVVALRKLSPLIPIRTTLQSYADTAAHILGLDTCITDEKRVIVASGPNAERILGKEIALPIDSIQQSVGLSKGSRSLRGFKPAFLTDSVDLDLYAAYIAAPVYYIGELAGYVIIMTKESDINAASVHTAKVAAAFFGKLFE